MKTKWPKEALVFERDDGVVYEVTDVHGDTMTFLVVVGMFGFPTSPMTFNRTPSGIANVTRPLTPAARAMLAIAKAGK